jgi:hypothetical protein
MIKLCIIELKNWNTYLKTTVEDTIDEAIIRLIGILGGTVYYLYALFPFAIIPS